MLSQGEIVGYMLEQRLVTPEQIVGGELVVRDLSRRNRNFTVETRCGTSYFLKQGVGVDGESTLCQESETYRFLTTLGDEFSKYLPRLCAYDAERNALILELVLDAEDLHARQLRSNHFPPDLAAALGRMLGTLHRLTTVQQPLHSSRKAPWVCSVHRPHLDIVRESSAASLEVIKIVQSTRGFAECLDQLRAEWSEAALVHYDAKWDNCLVARAWEGGDVPLKMVDWEAASRGDPGWDIGSVISEFLSAWVHSMAISGSDPPERLTTLAVRPLDRMKPAISSCWEAYVSAAGLNSLQARERLVLAVRYAAARLVQTALESMQNSSRLTSSAVLLLQLSANILQRPLEATGLLGLQRHSRVAW
jgi:aminoglycoside phosphotransferase (APT) family kinase protein